MIVLKIIKASNENKNIINEIVGIHLATFKGFFLTFMGKGFLKIMIEGKEWEFVISDEVQHKIDVFNKDKDNLKIMRGTMLQLKYEKKDLIFIATDIEIIQAN